MSEPFSAQWDEVLAVALMGTARRPVWEAPALPVVPRPAASAPATLLDHLAMGSVWSAAGAVPASSAPPTEPPAEALPVAPPAAVRLLELAITQSPGGASQRDIAVQTWATQALHCGYRVPERLVPSLLDLMVKRRDALGHILPVLGEVGRWLADQSPTWRPLLKGHTEGPAVSMESVEWAQLPVEQQIPPLLAAHSADPQSALQLLREAWATTSAADRLAHLEALEPQVTMADEPFLETCLDDRALNVRRAAGRLLGALPQSRRAQRMTERLAPLVQTERHMLRRVISVDLPPPADAAAARDGLPPGESAKERRSNLCLTVAATPLAFWDRVDMTPERIITGFERAGDNHVLHGLRLAAISQRDVTWLLALLRAGGLPDELLTALPRQDAEGFVAGELDKADIDTSLGLLGALSGGWGAPLTGQVLRFLARLPKGRAEMPLRLWGDRFHPSCSADLYQWLKKLEPADPLHRPLAGVASSIMFRQSISEAFNV